MLPSFTRFLNDNSPDIRAKIVGIYTLLGTFNVIIWVLTLLASIQYPIVLGLAIVAYSAGLRHGVDADHIAAVDNVTRKLMQEGKQPVSVGMFFAFGHSTVVIGLSAVVAVAASVVDNNAQGLKDAGSLIGTGVSVTFLYAIGILNLLILVEVFQMFKRVTRGGTYNVETLEQFLAQRGLMNRFFGPLVRAIDKSWKMYPLGLLFGLGFDTATQVAVLGISAASAGNGMPIIYIMLFPLLFAAGMSLVDTTDSVMMLGAYGWAFVKPVRKLYYNFVITLVSVMVALLVGTFEALGIIQDKFGLQGFFWDWIAKLDFGTIGYFIIGIFLISWLGSTLFYKLKHYDDIQAEPASPKPAVPTEEAQK